MNVLSLCSGIGGLDIAAKHAFGGRTVCYVEIDPYCQAVLQARMRDGWLDSAPIWPDLRTFNGLEWRGAVDCIVAGFPCQPFSSAGRRQGEQDERNLWPFVRRAIEAVRPAAVFLENVRGAVPYFWSDVLPDLQELGYAGPPPVITAAAEVGAGHIRERIFTLAYRGQAARKLLLANTVRQWARIEQGRGVGQDGQDALLHREAPGIGGLHLHAHAHGIRSPQQESKREAVGRDEHRGGALEGVLSPNAPQPDGRASANGVGLSSPDYRGPFAEGWWAAEPDVDRVVYGLSLRLDRVRALGNAVVSAQAELAYRILSGRLSDRI